MPRARAFGMYGSTLALVLSCAAPHAQATGSSVGVRIYNTYGIKGADVQQAQDVAAAILRAADIDTTWRDCTTSTGPFRHASDPCAQVLAPTEVIVRVIRAHDTWPAASFGYSYVDSLTAHGTLSTVFGDRIDAAVTRLRVATGTLLGRVIAHEVGHLLLGTADHGPSGLMRGYWSDESLERNIREEWLFSRGEATSIRAASLARMNGQPVPLTVRVSTEDAHSSR